MSRERERATGRPGHEPLKSAPCSAMHCIGKRIRRMKRTKHMLCTCFTKHMLCTCLCNSLALLVLPCVPPAAAAMHTRPYTLIYQIHYTCRSPDTCMLLHMQQDGELDDARARLTRIVPPPALHRALSLHRQTSPTRQGERGGRRQWRHTQVNRVEGQGSD